MPERINYGAAPLPEKTLALLKANGTIERVLQPLAATLQCAMCPIAQGRFYSARVEKCANMTAATARRNADRLSRAGVLVNSKKEQLRGLLGYEGTIIGYSVKQEVADSIPDPQPLPGCKMKPRT